MCSFIKLIKKDITISYYNRTGDVDFQVMVYSKNYISSSNYNIAWQILRGQGGVDFHYPAKLQVGACNESSFMKCNCGPLDAEPGTTWEIIQEQPQDTSYLRKVSDAPLNANGKIVVKNTVPSSWSGRKFDVGIYRDNKLLMQNKDLHVGGQAEFLVNPVLFFAVVRNVKFEEAVHIGEMTSETTMFDLSKYPTGINIYLYKTPGGGMYCFKCSPKENIEPFFTPRL